jgi:cytochrome P450
MSYDYLALTSLPHIYIFARTMGILPYLLLPLALFLFPSIFRWFRRRLQQSHYASPPTLPSWDPFFNLDVVRATMKSMAQDRRIRAICAQLREHSFTFQSFPFGRRVITSADPRNIQFVFATEADKFGVGPVRENAQTPLTGRGIITSDEPIWSRMRPLIRPTFTKAQIADREMFDVHVQRFLDLLPSDGQEVDLRPLLDRLVSACVPSYIT